MNLVSFHKVSHFSTQNMLNKDCVKINMLDIPFCVSSNFVGKAFRLCSVTKYTSYSIGMKKSHCHQSQTCTHNIFIFTTWKNKLTPVCDSTQVTDKILHSRTESRVLSWILDLPVVSLRRSHQLHILWHNRQIFQRALFRLISFGIPAFSLPAVELFQVQRGKNRLGLCK